jgi:hypothetical protein
MKSGYVAQHRMVAEENIGRYLTGDEVVHHRNGDASDNDWLNLQVMTQSEHVALHREHGDLRPHDSIAEEKK